MKKEGLEVLINRIRFLNHIFSNSKNESTQHILFYLSRLFDINSTLENHNIDIDQTSIIQSVWQVSGFIISISFSNQKIEEKIINILYQILTQIKQKENWNQVNIVDVYLVNHLTCSFLDNGIQNLTLNSKEIINTLVRCFKSEMIHSISSPEYLVLHHLFNCFKEFSKMDHTNFEEISLYSYPILWITRDIFQEYLEKLEEINISYEGKFNSISNMGISEVPESTLLQKFDQVVETLISFPIVISLQKSYNNQIFN